MNILNKLNKITELSLPSAETIGHYAFAYNKITELSLPNIKKIEYDAFTGNPLTTVTLGTAFTKPTTIEIVPNYHGAFDGVETEKCDLVLGEFVLPLRDGNEWNGYIWKSINLC